MVTAQLSRDVQVVYASLDARRYQGLGCEPEGACAIQKDFHSLFFQDRDDDTGAMEIEDSVGGVEGGGKLCDTGLGPTCKDERQAGSLGLLAGEATGVASRAVNHNSRCRGHVWIMVVVWRKT